MSASISQQKSALRAAMAVALAAMTSTERLEGSAQARDRLRQAPVWREARRIMFYAPRHDEIDLWPLAQEALEAGNTVVLPRYDRDRQTYAGVRVENLESDVQTGHFGIREPWRSDCIFPLNQLDLILVPGVAFNPNGCRLGRGKGYYDRILAAAGGTFCGVGWDVQVQAEIPAERHDIKLHCILTPTRWLIAGPSWSGNDFAGK